MGAGLANVIALTIGTGIGAGIILNGELQRGDTGIAGEAGHIIVNPSGDERCGCGATGCLEAMASGTALGRLGGRAAAVDPAGLLATLAGQAGDVTGETVHEAARRGDPTALLLFNQIGYWLGVGIASLANVFDPQLVILGGGLVNVNIQMAALKDRVREVGVKMAIGASGGEVFKGFMTEALLLTGLGSLVGLVGGVAFSAAITAFLKIPLFMQPKSFAWALVMAAAFGFVFALYPAWKASRLSPMEALRYE